MCRRRPEYIDNPCNSRRLVYRTDRQPLSTAIRVINNYRELNFMNVFVARSWSFLIVCIVVLLYGLFSNSAPQGCKCAQKTVVHTSLTGLQHKCHWQQRPAQHYTHLKHSTFNWSLPQLFVISTNLQNTNAANWSYTVRNFSNKNFYESINLPLLCLRLILPASQMFPHHRPLIPPGLHREAGKKEPVSFCVHLFLILDRNWWIFSHTLRKI